jgi:2-amino-4-hydroxy-6-hydroxymethyldihydropteridine diphosphokinase
LTQIDALRGGLSAAPRYRAYVGMGGNLGDVLANLQSALGGMHSLPGTLVEAVSPLYCTEPVEASGPDYLNAVAVIQSSLGPMELLHALQRLETAHERERPYQNAPRTLDLDLLWYGNLRRQTPELTLPHPRMMLRAFVLIPLAEALAALGDNADAALLAEMLDKATRAALAQEQGVTEAGSLAWSKPVSK